MNNIKETLNRELQKQIIKYLESKGKIKAELFYKLEKRFCKKDSKFKVKKQDLVICLFSMMKEKIIEILIPAPYHIRWETEHLNNLTYLKDGDYLIRKVLPLYHPLLKFNIKDNYLFTSRNIDFDKECNNEVIENIKNLIKYVPEIKYETIIYYPKGSLPLNIYESSQGIYEQKFLDFKIPIEFKQDSKIEIPLEEQSTDLKIITSYRTKYMCFYITLIESIQNYIVSIQANQYNIVNYYQVLLDCIKRFGYYCEIYTRADWVENLKPNPYRWETFFSFFNIPIKIISLSFKSIKFYGKTFDLVIEFKFCIFIKKKYDEEIMKLKMLGFQEFLEENNGEDIAIGLKLEIFLPCPTIEHFYFLGKYIFYYHLFLLFSYSFNLINKNIQNCRLSSVEQSIYKIFLPLMESLFNIRKGEITKKLVFKYYCHNSEELEVIYNKFLIKTVRDIEKKLFNYFLIRTTKN